MPDSETWQNARGTVWPEHLEILLLKCLLNLGKQVIGRCESSDQEYCLKMDERGQRKPGGSRLGLL